LKAKQERSLARAQRAGGQDARHKPEQIKRVWRLDELAAQAAHVLSALALAQSSGRVREVPDRRTIRYYATLGLLSRPLGHRGRAALYGWEHLVQLVAIKRLQIKGLSLSDIQEELVGAPLAQVEALAAIPGPLREALFDPSVGQAEEKGEQAAPGDEQTAPRAFWKQSPPAAPTPAPPKPDTASERDGTASGPEGVRALQEVALARGVTLLLEAPGRALDEDDVEAIKVAAGPLLKVLYARHLLRAQEQGE